MKRFFLFILFAISLNSYAQIIYEEDFNGEVWPEEIVRFDYDDIEPTIFLDPWLMSDTSWYQGQHPGMFNTEGWAAVSTGFHKTESGDNIPGPVYNVMVLPELNVPDENTVLFYQGKNFSNSSHDTVYVLVDRGTAVLDTIDMFVHDYENVGLYNYQTNEVSLADYIGEDISIQYHHHMTESVHIVLDNIKIFSTTNLVDDIAIGNSILSRYAEVGEPLDYVFEVKNTCVSLINSFILNYAYGETEGAIVYENTAIAVEESKVFSADDLFVFDEEGCYPIEIWLSAPNGNDDANPEDNVKPETVTTILEGAEVKVLVEEVTGTWCGWCPRGAVELENLKNKYGDKVIAVAHHGNDAMEMDEYAELTNEIPIAGSFPSAAVNRYPFQGSLGGNATNTWDQLVGQAIEMVCPAGVESEVYLDEEKRELTINATVNFVVDDIADFRLNCIITQDGITGYPQNNYFSGQSNTGYPELEELPNPIPDWVHNHVSKSMLGGPIGVEDAIPNQVYAGDEFEYTFVYSIPEDMDLDMLHVVTYLSNHPETIMARNIINSDEVSAGEFKPVGLNEITASGVQIYPNPAKDLIHIYSSKDIEYVELYSLGGQKLMHTGQCGTQFSIALGSLQQGLYLLKLRNADGVQTHKLVVD